jgi:hypothetical protein
MTRLAKILGGRRSARRFWPGRLTGSARRGYGLRVRSMLVVLLIAGCGTAAHPRVDRRAQLPVHRYPITGSVGRLVIDAGAFGELARPLRADVERDLADFDIRDRASLQDRWFILALLDALDGRWDDALEQIDRIAAVELRPADKVMTGLTIRVWVDAIAHGGGPAAFRAALERKLSTMPIEVVRGQLAMLRAMGRVFTPEVCRGLVDDEIGAHLEGGALSLEQAQAVAFQRYAVVHLVPVGAVIDEVLGGHGIEAPH